MTPLKLQGATLGQKHRHFNSLVNQAILDNVDIETVLEQPTQSDIDVLYKMDLANHYKNVNYFLDILKTGDMLYISRAFKKGGWLIADNQYAHIVNPQYLHTELIPHLTSKAMCKLFLNIRLHLKDETRVEGFFKYYEKSDINKALKWLPNCSEAFIKDIVNRYATIIDFKYIIRLCDKCPEAFDIYLKKNSNTNFIDGSYMSAARKLLHVHAEKYLDKIEKTIDRYYLPKIGKRPTALLMKQHRQRLIDNFHKYRSIVDLKTLARCTRADIPGFCEQLSRNQHLKLWFKYENLKHFIKYVPKQDRFQFFQKFLIDVNSLEHKGTQGPSHNQNVVYPDITYQLYEYAPFDIAFTEMMTLIKAEPTGMKRRAMLKVMLVTAGTDESNVRRVLQYYHNRHINESFNIKINFISDVLDHTNTHRYSEDTWNILNEIFHSAEVYIKSDNRVQSCVECIIVYNILHKLDIPEIILSKFVYNTLVHLKHKLNTEERKCVFNYLFNDFVTVKNERDYSTVKSENDELIVRRFNLLVQWDMNILDYPSLTQMLEDYIKSNEFEYGKYVLQHIYNCKKSWRKYFLKMSIIMYPGEGVVMNALKHDPTLLDITSNELETICCDSKIKLDKCLSKVKIYWAGTLAKDWADCYRNLLKCSKDTSHYQSLVRGLCVLLPYKELLAIAENLIPEDDKVNWREANPQLLCLRQNYAKYLQYARPQFPPSVILQFAKGDYLKYALPSLLSVFYNLPPSDFNEYLSPLLNQSISLQKHGIRIAFAKADLIDSNLPCEIWNRSKNATIRCVVFQLTLKLLIEKKDEEASVKIWKLLDYFMCTVSEEERLLVYGSLENAIKVPLCVRADFILKSYRFIEKLPPHIDRECWHNSLLALMPELIDRMDADFIADILLGNIKNSEGTHDFTMNSTQRKNLFIDVLANYLLCCNSEEVQKMRLQKLMMPWLEVIFNCWHKQVNVQLYLLQFLKELTTITLEKCLVNKYISPLYLYNELKSCLEAKFSFDEVYCITIYCKLIIAYYECCVQIISSKGLPKNSKDLWALTSSLFAHRVLMLLKEDVAVHHAGIQKTFFKVYINFHKCYFYCYDEACYNFLKVLISDSKCVPAHLVAVELLSDPCHSNEVKTETFNLAEEFNLVSKTILANSNPEVRMNYYLKFHYKKCITSVFKYYGPIEFKYSTSNEYHDDDDHEPSTSINFT